MNKHSEQYKNQLMTDKDFAKRVEEKRKAENERQKRRRRLIRSRSSKMMKISNFFLRTSLVKKGFGDPLGTHTGRSISLSTWPLVNGVFYLNIEY